MAYSKQNFQNGQILNAANLEAMENGIIAGQGAHNLLDNSDFTNPVNQRGKTSYSGGEYAIDRWKMQSGTNMTLMDGFIRITGEWDTRQYLREKLIGTYTFAVYAKVNVAGGYTQTIEVFENDSPIASSMCTGVGEWKIYTCTTTFTGANNITNPMVIINNRAGSISDASMDVQWAALYEGSYTSETLPPYVPNGKHVEMLNCNVPLAPRNLLDNSDFRNPVNQRGRTEASGNGYFIDRWGNYNGTSKVVSSGIQVNANKDSAAFLYQYIKALRDGTYTFAAKVNGNIVLRVIQISGTTVTSINGDKAGYTGGYLVVIYANDDKFEFDFRVESGATITVEWAALYEGSYDASTLPPYIPKDKHIEMLNCGVSLAPYNLLDNSDFRNPVNQRGQSSYTGSKYGIDRWRTWNDSATITITSDGIKGDGTEASVLYQTIGPNKVVSGKSYTIAAGYSDSSVSCKSGIISTDTNVGIWTSTEQVFFAYNDGVPFVRLWHATKTIAWVALYEGAYTTDTLPAYQPKGYAAELAECMRYFERLGGTSSQTLGNAVFAKAGTKSVIISIKYSPKRLSNPTLSLSVPSDYRMLQKDAVNASTVSACSITSFDNIATETPFAYFRVNLADALQSDLWLVLQRADGAKGAYIDVNADM